VICAKQGWGLLKKISTSGAHRKNSPALFGTAQCYDFAATSFFLRACLIRWRRCRGRAVIGAIYPPATDLTISTACTYLKDWASAICLAPSPQCAGLCRCRSRVVVLLLRNRRHERCERRQCCQLGLKELWSLARDPSHAAARSYVVYVRSVGPTAEHRCWAESLHTPRFASPVDETQLELGSQSALISRNLPPRVSSPTSASHQ